MRSWAWLAGLVATVAFAAKAPASSEMIGKILEEKQANKVVQSVHLVRLSDGKTLYEKNPDTLVTPASVTKVLTAATALVKFSPARTFRTPLFHTGARKNETIMGDLVIVGDGDPFVVSEKLWQLAADLRLMGIREFKGDLVIDNSLFPGDGRDASRKVGTNATRNAYDAPVSAFGVNFNTFAVAVAPADGAGKPALVALDPYPLRNVVIENNVKTTKQGKSVDVKRVSQNGGEKLVATGTIDDGAGIHKVYRSVGDHVKTSGEYVKAFLKGEGIVVSGQVREGKKPANATPLIEMEGYDMRRIVSGLNTFSNNFIADVLVKRLGAEFHNGVGTYENGIAVIEEFLRKDVGIKGEMVIENGSGLATENRLSARQVTQVLAYMERRMDVFPDFLASLPATGWDGTMKKRFAKEGTSEFKGQFRAKTGTLSEPISVSGLAGYFRHPKHGMVAFCLIENGEEGQKQPAIGELRDRQDRVLVSFMNEL